MKLLKAARLLVVACMTGNLPRQPQHKHEFECDCALCFCRDAILNWRPAKKRPKPPLKRGGR